MTKQRGRERKKKRQQQLQADKPYALPDEAQSRAAAGPKLRIMTTELLLEPDEEQEHSSDPTVRGKEFIIVEVFDYRLCPKCKDVTSVFAFFLPPGHERINDDGEWEVFNEDVLLSAITYLNDNAIRAMREVARNDYRPDVNRIGEGPYWLNHCESCGAVLDDWDEHKAASINKGIS
jgi:hypothetical protein